MVMEFRTGLVWERLRSVFGHLKHRKKLLPQSTIILRKPPQLGLSSNDPFISYSY